MTKQDQYKVLKKAGFNESTIDKMDDEQREYEAEAYVYAEREAQAFRDFPESVDPVNF